MQRTRLSALTIAAALSCVAAGCLSILTAVHSFAGALPSLSLDADGAGGLLMGALLVAAAPVLLVTVLLSLALYGALALIGTLLVGLGLALPLRRQALRPSAVTFLTLAAAAGLVVLLVQPSPLVVAAAAMAGMAAGLLLHPRAAAEFVR